MLEYTLSAAAENEIVKSLSGGGFTFSLKNGLVKDGFAVSIFPELERKYLSKHNDWYRWIPEIERYMNKCIQFLSRPRVCLGGWWQYGEDGYNPEGYSLFLDITIICPNERSAIYLCRKYHQVAYYDLTHQKEFKVPASIPDLLDRMKDIPEVKTWKLYCPTSHYPPDVLSGQFKGDYNVGEPGVVFYDRDIGSAGPYIAYLERDLAIADVEDPALISRIPLTTHAETALAMMGYDGYKSDGKVFLFGDIEIDEVRRYA